MGYKILIADDYDLNRNLIRMILENKVSNASFFEVEDGNQVIESIHKYDIDLVILDLIMPEKNGFQVLIEMKSDAKYSNIPIIVNSSLDDMDNIKKALQIGALDYFVKPLTKDDMNVVLPIKAINALQYYEQKKALIRLNDQMIKELEIANLFQSSLITEFKNMGSARMYGRYIPCSRIGGDFFECVQSDDRIWFIIADVCGHGVVAAMISSMIKIAFMSSIRDFSTPGEVISKINALFCNSLGEDNSIFFTAFIGVIDDKTLSYSNAGHYFPIVINPGSKASVLLSDNDIPAGIDKNVIYKSRTVLINKGDCIISYTDGLFGSSQESADTDWERINDYCIENSRFINTDPKNFIDNLILRFAGYSSDNRKDDITLMLIQIM